jgi:hypothetical protein
MVSAHDDDLSKDFNKGLEAHVKGSCFVRLIVGK